MERLQSPALWREVFGWLGTVDVVCALSGCCRRLRAEADAWLGAVRHLEVELPATEAGQVAVVRRLAARCHRLCVLSLAEGLACAEATGEDVLALLSRNQAHLEQVELWADAALRTRVLDVLGDCPRLRHLEASHFCPDTPSAERSALLRTLAKRSDSLRRVRLGFCLAVDESRAVLATLLAEPRALVELQLSNVDQVAVAHLAHAPCLEQLSLTVGPRVSLARVVDALGTALAASGAAARLRELTLNVDREAIFEDDQRQCCEWRLPALQELRFHDFGGSYAARRPRHMSSGWRLRAPCLQLLGAGLLLSRDQYRGLAAPSVVRAALYGWKVTDVAECCGTWPALTALHAEFVRLSDADVLAVLAACPRLETCTLDTRDSDAAPLPLAEKTDPDSTQQDQPRRQRLLEHAHLRELTVHAGSEPLLDALSLPALTKLVLVRPTSPSVSCDSLAACCPSLECLGLLGLRRLPSPPAQLPRLRELRVSGARSGSGAALKLWLREHPCLEVLNVEAAERVPLHTIFTAAVWRALPGWCPRLGLVQLECALGEVASASQLPSAKQLAALFRELPALSRFCLPALHSPAPLVAALQHCGLVTRRCDVGDGVARVVVSRP